MMADCLHNTKNNQQQHSGHCDLNCHFSVWLLVKIRWKCVGEHYQQVGSVLYVQTMRLSSLPRCPDCSSHNYAVLVTSIMLLHHHTSSLGPWEPDRVRSGRRLETPDRVAGGIVWHCSVGEVSGTCWSHSCYCGRDQVLGCDESPGQYRALGHCNNNLI